MIITEIKFENDSMFCNGKEIVLVNGMQYVYYQVDDEEFTYLENAVNYCLEYGGSE